MRKTIVAGVVAVLGLASGAAVAQGSYYDGGNGDVVRCESVDSRTRECPADTRNGVHLVRQLSSERCIEGRNWGVGNRFIWVAGGCRADFEVGRRSAGDNSGWGGSDWNGGNGNRTLRCESVDRRTQECAANARRGVRLVRQLSDTRCVEGRTWGYHPDRVWVSGGCRAEFEVGRGGDGGGSYGNRIVQCESTNQRTRECAANTRGGVRLVRQLSDTRCVEGQNWGYHSDRVWVAGGCRAEFEVGRGWDGY